MYYYIEPEIAGRFGEKTQKDTSVHPPDVQRLHYEFDSWLGDDLLTSFPCYLVSERLRQSLESENLTGYSIDEAMVTRSDQFEELYPDEDLPEFHWLRIKGKAGADDFGIAADHRLVISEAVYMLLTETSSLQCEHAVVEEYE